ncbi:MAG TPA: NAD(P)-binding oxidoreductase [Nocardioidaceae bacterium]|nr:NAD(P)-binding oxidoreductase [Nocardioidaceae bacterium]
MTSPILLTGGTGTLGRQVVPLLRARDQKLRILSRSPHAPTDGIEYATGDLATAEGVEAAVTGTEIIVHLAGTMKGDEDKAATLVRAAADSGVRHLVYISVVGADRVPVVSRTDRAMFGYFASKRAAEHVVIDSGLPWTILRATQFHDLIHLTARQLSKLPVMPIFAGVRFQPVDAHDVAERLVELALDRPMGLAPDIGGPQVYGMKELMRSYLTAKGRHRLTLPIRTPGGASKAYRAGANLTLDGATIGTRTWEDFLAEQTTR